MSVDNDDITTQQNQSVNGFSANGANGASEVADAMHPAHLDDGESTDMSEMAKLLEEQDVQFRSIKRGDVVEGQIVRIDPEEILVDIGLKSEGVLTTKELPPSGYGSLAELHVGDDVLVYIMQPETPEGHAVVSIKRARLERQWRIAQEQFDRGDLLEAEVIDFNKGGLIVNLEGIRGFVPISQILNLKREDTADSAETQSKLQTMVGRRLQLKIIEINRNRNRLILSERLAVQEWRAKRREELLNELQVGEVRKGVVSNLSNFGAFVDLGGADGLVHISQLAWSRVNHPSEVLRVGQEVEVQVLSVDKEKKKIALSIKRAEVDPWTTVETRYVIGELVKGTVTKIAPFGAFARIEDGVEGLIHLSELPSGVQDPKQILREGQEVTVRILRIDAERRRLGLSIRQVDETAEEETAEASEASAPQDRTSSEAPAEGRVDVGTAPAPAPQQQQPAPRPRREEEAPTAMGAAFAAAAAAASKVQQDETPVETAEAPEPAQAAETASAASEATAEVPAPAATPAAAAEAPAPDAVEADVAASSDTPEAGAIEPEASPNDATATSTNAEAVEGASSGSPADASDTAPRVTRKRQGTSEAPADEAAATEGDTTETSTSPEAAPSSDAE